MFRNLIDRAQSLVARLEVVKQALRDGTFDKLPDSQQVAWSEIDGWLDAAADVIVQAFGEHSKQIRKWKDKYEAIRERDRHDAAKGRFKSEDAIIYTIKTMNGLLLEFQDIWEARRQSKPPDEPIGRTRMPDSKCVFVICGQNRPARDAMVAFLRSIGLKPLEWGQARALTKEPSPYIGDILEATFAYAQAFVVLLTGDDEARLRDRFINEESPAADKNLTPQARPNVVFEAGMAMGRHPERTILVELGPLRPFSDVAGRHVIRLNDSAAMRKELVQRLRTAGCDLDDTGSDWLSIPSFDETV